MRYFSATTLVVCVTLLAACATAPTPPPAAPAWEEHRRQVTALSNWRASGKIALRTARGADSASLLWEQAGAATHLELSGPLGFAATTVESDGHYLAISRGDEYHRWNLDDTELAAANQWDLPLAALQYWLRGVPAPDSVPATLEFDSQSRLPRLLQQQGWTVEYTEYALFGTYSLPSRLEVSRGATRARILLRDWQLGPLP